MFRKLNALAPFSVSLLPPEGLGHLGGRELVAGDFQHLSIRFVWCFERDAREGGDVRHHGNQLLTRLRSQGGRKEPLVKTTPGEQEILHEGDPVRHRVALQKFFSPFVDGTRVLSEDAIVAKGRRVTETLTALAEYVSQLLAEK